MFQEKYVFAQVLAFYTVTTASKYDSTAMSSIPYEPNSYYIFNRAYKTHLRDLFDKTIFTDVKELDYPFLRDYLIN